MAYIWKNVIVLPWTFNTEEYTGDGGDSLEKNELYTFSILAKAF